MQTLNPIVKERSPVKLSVYDAVTNQLIFEKMYTPRGLRHDIAMFIFTQLVVDADNVNIEITETAVKHKKLILKNVSTKKGDGVFVVLHDGKLVVADNVTPQ